MGRYVAKRPLDVGGDEVTHYEPGEEVPDAEAFAELDSLLAQGFLEEKPTGGRSGASTEPDSPYGGMTVPELREQLADRGLPTSGKKADLLARLEESGGGE